MNKQEEMREWTFVMLRPICVSDEHCEAYVSDLFRGLSKRGVVIKVVDGELPKNRYNGWGDKPNTQWYPFYIAHEEAQQAMLKAGYVAIEPLIKDI